MYKSIELGRAVLSTSTPNLELWLKTLITISSQQDHTDFELHTATPLLETLSSGEAWVGRGNGLYIDLVLTYRGQPLANEQLQCLSDAILCAPVWAQLRLLPSLPHTTTCEPGKLRIVVNHALEEMIPAAKQRHRVFSDVSATDVRPPEAVPTFFLDAILCCMDIFETVQRRRTIAAKRLKVSANSNNASPPTSQPFKEYNQRVPENLLVETESMDLLPAILSPTKRKWEQPGTPTKTISKPATLFNGTSGGYKSSSDTRKLQEGMLGVEMDLNAQGFKSLIDGALRLSVASSINSRYIPGVKVKANTFGPGLADIAPILWKPGYLLSISQRANLLPVICRSIHRAIAINTTTSMHLKEKLQILAKSSSAAQAAGELLERLPEDLSNDDLLSASVALRLWLHLQKNTPCRSGTPLQSFMAAMPPTPVDRYSDDILEQPWQGAAMDYRSRPDIVGSAGNGAPCIDPLPNGVPETPTTYDVGLSEQHVLGTSGLESLSQNVEDDLLLGDERFTALTSISHCIGAVF